MFSEIVQSPKTVTDGWCHHCTRVQAPRKLVCPSLTFHLALISHPSHCDKSEFPTILSKSEVLRN